MLLIILQTKSTETMKPSALAGYVIPDGWYTPKRKLDQISDDFPAEDYGLPNDVEALLRSESMDTFLIMCAGEYYFYNEVSEFVTRIVEPTGLPNIIAELRENGRKNIKTEFLHYV